MALFVIETAVAVKWFVPERHSSSAARLLDGGHEMLAPDTLVVDAGKILAAKARLGECTREEGIRVLEAISLSPLRLHPSGPLVEPAFIVSTAIARPFTDGMNLALAVASDCRVITAAKDLFERVQGTPFAAHVKWVGDLR